MAEAQARGRDGRQERLRHAAGMDGRSDSGLRLRQGIEMQGLTQADSGEEPLGTAVRSDSGLRVGEAGEWKLNHAGEGGGAF